MEDLTIRRMSLLDRTAVIKIYQSAMSSTPWFENLSEELVSGRIGKDFRQNKSEQFVGVSGIRETCAAMWWDEVLPEILAAQRGEELSNYCQNNFSGRTVWFRDLIIRSDHQGKGLGGQMLDFALRRWKSSGYKFALLRIHLGGVNNIISPNTKAIKLYSGRGFRLIEDIRKISKDINGNSINMGYMIAAL